MRIFLRFCGVFFLFIAATAIAEPGPEPLPTLELLQRLIKIDTTNPPGNEIQAAQFVKDYLAKFKIDSEIIESSPGRASLIARLKGNGSQEPIVLLGHLDVVTADPKEWTYPPFDAKVINGVLYGRGSIDMKGMVALEIATLVRLKQEGHPLSGDVLLVLVADEEAGGNAGAKFLTEKYWDKIKPRFVINEGSIGLDKGNIHLYPIQVAEKGVAWMKLTATGTSGHGSMPTHDNAVVKLIQALDRIADSPQPIKKTAIVQEFLSRLSSQFSFPKSFLLKHFFDWPVRNLISFFGGSKIESEKIFNAMIKNTVVPTVLSAGSKTNVIPAEATALVDCRILPGETPDGFKEKLENIIDNPEIKIELTQQSLPSESNFNTPYFAALQKAIEKNDPKAIVVPFISPGATDSRFFRAKGIISYGIIPFVISTEELEGLHGKNERVRILEISRGENILYDLVTMIQ